jgi:hypothetical protein
LAVRAARRASNETISVFSSLAMRATISSCIVKKIGDRLVESLRPQVRAGLRLDQLNVDAHALAAALDAALEHIADPEVAADLPRIGGLALVGERRVARDDESAGQARKVGRQTLGHAVDKIVLLFPAADIREGQHDNGEARPAGRLWRGGRLLRLCRAAGHGVDPHGPRDVLQRFLAEIREFRLDAAADMLMGRSRNANAAGFGDPFQPRGDVDAVADKIPALDDHVA